MACKDAKLRCRGVWCVLMTCVSLLAGTGTATAQTVTVAGQSYEPLLWVPQAANTGTASGSWVTASGGSLSATSTSDGVANPGVRAAPFNTVPVAPSTVPEATFTNPGFGAYALAAPVSSALIDQGQRDGDVAMVTSFTLSGVQYPTEVLYLVGGEAVGSVTNNGMKFSNWAWASNTAGTTFTLLGSTTLSVQNVAGSGSGALSWDNATTAPAPPTNNRAVAVVRIANPAGVRDFNITTLRLNANGTPLNPSPSAVQRADFSYVALLLSTQMTPSSPVASTEPQPVPGAPGGMVAAALALAYGWARRWHRR